MNIFDYIYSNTESSGDNLITEAGKPSVIKVINREEESGHRRYGAQWSQFSRFFGGDNLAENKKYKFRFKGTIQDKAGNVYDLSCRVTASNNSPWSSMYHCAIDIFEVVNGDDATFEAECKFYSDTKHDLTMLTDLKEGIYLEDFFAKHYEALANEDKSLFDELISSGDKSAESFYKKERQREAAADKRFWEAKIRIRDDFGWNVQPGGQLNVVMQAVDSKNPWVGKAEEIVSKYVADYLEEKFKVKLQDLTGLVGYGKLFATGVNSWQQTLYVDTSKNTIVCIDAGKSKIISKNITVSLGGEVTIKPSEASKFAIALFMMACEEFVKGLKGKKGEWVEKNYSLYKCYQDPYNPYGYSKHRSDTEAYKVAREEFDKMKNAHIWDGEKTIKLKLEEFEQYIQIVADQFKGAVKEEPEEVKATETPTVQEAPKTSAGSGKNLVQQGLRGKTTAVSSKDAREKMQAWHDGTRGFNVKAAGDAKLKVNYAACKDLGLEKEMEIIKAEADSRGLVLETRSLYESLLNFLS